MIKQREEVSKMKLFTDPILDVVKVEVQDIITTSNPGSGGDWGTGDF